MKSLKKDLTQGVAISLLLTCISYLAGVILDWIDIASINFLELFGILISYTSIYLSVKERRINYILGAISSIAHIILFIQNGLIASAVLSIYLAPTLIYGWFRWGKDSRTRPITHVRIKTIPLYVLATAMGYIGSLLISQYFNITTVWTDSIILIGSILAQFLLDNKKIETWIIWILVNLFAIYTYAENGLPLIAFKHIFLLINAAYAYHIWKSRLLHTK